MVTDVGEILISYGDFAENNHKLEKPSFTIDYWNILARKAGISIEDYEEISPTLAFALSRKYSVPLHPSCTYFWHDISVDDLKDLYAEVYRSSCQS